MNLRRLFLIALAAGLLWLAAGIVRGLLASDETRVRWAVEDMVEGFNDAELAPVMSGLAADFVDAASGARRAEVREALLHLYFNEIDASTREFRYRIEFAPEDLSVTLPEPGRASVELRARFLRRRGGAEEPFWDARIAGDMELQDGDWRWKRTSSVNHADRPRL